MVGEEGLEPSTPGLEGRCSVQLSYSPVALSILAFRQLIREKRPAELRLPEILPSEMRLYGQLQDNEPP